MPPAAATRFAAWSAALRFDEVPPAVVEAAKLHLLDTIGCGLAAQALGLAGAARDVVRETGGLGEASAIGVLARLPAPAAALANGMLCHGLDYDDTHADSVCHVSAVVSTAAVAAAEAAAARGDELVTALVAGNEITTRIGMAASGAFHRRGFHPTSVCGVFGAAAAAARLARLPAAGVVNALGLAGSLASGIFEHLADGSATKPVHAGLAAQNGILAARLAARGATGPATVLEGRFGLFAAFADLRDVGLERHLDDLGRRWQTPRIAFKPYPACHFVHAPIDAALAAAPKRPLAPAEIGEIVVGVPEVAIPIVLEPLGEKRAPKTAYDAKFSLPFALASALVRGRVGLDAYTDAALGDAEVLALAAKVRYERGEFPTSPASFPGRVRIVFADGAARAAEVAHQRGGAENPLATDDVRAKFRANASLALALADVERLERGILALDESPDVRDVFAPLAAAALGGRRSER